MVYSWTGRDGSSKSSIPGPVISVDRGTRVRLRVKNELTWPTHPQWAHELKTSTHLHGSASLPQYDGYADDVTKPGYYKDYEYPNHQPARTLWYHDHGVHHTAKNAYSGLAAQYHLHDPDELNLLPQGKYDVPLTINDVLFDSAGKLLYDDHDSSGLWGDVVLVNGKPWPFMEVERRVYRFRILMASLSRSMTLKLVNVATGQAVPVHFVATDGGLMPKRQTVTSWRQASAERYEILVDFGALRRACGPGRQFELRNTSAKNNRDYLHTGQGHAVPADRSAALPWRSQGTRSRTTLVGSTAMGLTAAMASRTRRIELDHDDVTNQFLIDGKSWSDVQNSKFSLLADGTNPDVGAVETWEIENKSGGWFHPLHIHLVDFKILSRRGGSGRVQPYEQGPKDVVYVGEGETVRVIMKYEMPPETTAAGPAARNSGAGGRYMIHCHNLPHEDNDMMQQFQVGKTPEVNDPMTTAKPQPIPTNRVYRDGQEQTPDNG